MKTKFTPELVTFDDTFFGMHWEKLPSFEDLLKETLGLPDLDANEEPEPATRQRIIDQLAPIHEICEWAGYEPLITEFALIADRRILSLKQEAFFSSFISAFLPCAKGTAAAYHQALRFMASPDAGGEQIVPHPELFNGETGFLHLNLNKEAKAFHASDAAPVKGTKPVHLTAVRQGFHMVSNAKCSLQDQVATFVTYFLELVEASPDLHAAHGLLSRCSFLLIPFLRPAFQSTVREDPRDQGDVYPGGALFLFLRHSRGSRPAEELARAISWLLVAGSLSEAYSAYEVDQKQKDLLGSMVHGTVHAIRSIGSTQLCRALSYKEPPESTADLRVRIFKEHSDEEDEVQASELVTALNAVMLGEDAAAALLAFCEMNLQAGPLLEKFQSDQEREIIGIIGEALLLVNRWVKNRSGYNKVELSTSEISPSGCTEGHWVLPKHYLTAGFVRGILAEFLKNAAHYGEPSAKGAVEVACKVVIEPNGGVTLNFVNKVRGDILKTTADRISGFLERTRSVLTNVDGLDLWFNKEGNPFHLVLWLGPLLVQRASDGDTKPIKLSPHWLLSNN